MQETITGLHFQKVELEQMEFLQYKNIKNESHVFPHLNTILLFIKTLVEIEIFTLIFSQKLWGVIANWLDICYDVPYIFTCRMRTLERD